MIFSHLLIPFSRQSITLQLIVRVQLLVFPHPGAKFFDLAFIAGYFSYIFSTCTVS